LKKKYTLIIIVLIILSVILFFFGPILFYTIIPSTFEKSIVRNSQGVEEANALSTVENFNYTYVFQVKRFDGSTDPEDYLHPKIYLTYTYAHVIDTEVLEYYDRRSEGLKGNPDIKFTYEANVYAWDQIKVVYLNERTLHVLSPNGTVLYENPEFTGVFHGMRFVVANDSGYVEIQPEELNMTFSNCFLVEMKLWYSEMYAPLAAYSSDVYQTVIVDEHYKPLLVWLESKGTIS
jgi:hypothetical protein